MLLAESQQNLFSERLFTVVTDLGKSTSLESKEEFETKIKLISERMPAEFDIKNCVKKFSYNLTKCQNIVLLQELNKYNNLLHVIQKSLDQLQAAMQGQIIMTAEMDEVNVSLLNNNVPKLWENNAYPSMKPVSSWIEDLNKRVKFFQNWVENESTPSYWICYELIIGSKA